MTPEVSEGGGADLRARVTRERRQRSGLQYRRLQVTGGSEHIWLKGLGYGCAQACPLTSEASLGHGSLREEVGLEHREKGDQNRRFIGRTKSYTRFLHK